MAPFTEVAGTLDPIGLGQRPDAGPKISASIGKPSSSQRFTALATTMAVFCGREVMAAKMI
jgi:hypothetical protein